MLSAKPLQAVVLMGGLGTRLAAATTGLPKAMVDVRGRPFFSYQLDLMRWQGFREFVFCVGHQAAAIQEYFGDGSRFGVTIGYSSDGPTLLGTAGALRRASPLLEPEFVLLYGDSYMDLDFGELACVHEAEHAARGVEGTMTVLRNRGRWERSNALVDGPLVTHYDKRAPTPQMEHVDYGVTLLRRSAIEDLPEGTPTDLADVYTRLAGAGRLAAYPTSRRFYEIGTPAALDEFRRLIGEHQSGLRRTAVFLDRDGIINEPVPDPGTGAPDSPMRPAELKLYPEVPGALATLRALGFRLIVVTNQPAAAKGKASLRDLYAVNARMKALLADQGVELDAVLMCPHHPVGEPGTAERRLVRECSCRKPKPGMLEQAIERYDLDRDRCFMVGDRDTDVLAGTAAGVPTIRVVRGPGPVSVQASWTVPDLGALARRLRGDGNEAAGSPAGQDLRRLRADR